MSKRTLILDSDGGVDDAQALILLVANGRAPDIITTVFGNVGRDQATTNLLAVTAHLGVSIPVHRGADRPLTQPVIDAKYVHGDDGLGGAPRPATQDDHAPDDAIGVLADFGNWPDSIDRYDALRQILPYTVATHAKVNDIDEFLNHPRFDHRRCVQLCRNAGFEGHLGIEFESETLDPVIGIRRGVDLLRPML